MKVRTRCDVARDGRRLDKRCSSLRVLEAEELECVTGGILPAAGFAVALAGHIKLFGVAGGTITMAKGVAAHLLTGFGLGAAAYALGPRAASGKSYSATVMSE